MSRWKQVVSKLDPRKLRKKLRRINRKRRRQTKKGHAHPELDAQARRLKKKLAYLKKVKDKEINSDGYATYTAPSGRKTLVAPWWIGKAKGPDGKVINWFAKFRKDGWDGELSSGARSPAYSKSLCIRMCNAPSCPGKCAGENSNHVGNGKDFYPGSQTINYGAVDVYPQYTLFGQLALKHKAPFRNSLGAADPVHYSPSGR